MTSPALAVVPHRSVRRARDEIAFAKIDYAARLLRGAIGSGFDEVADGKRALAVEVLRNALALLQPE